jgi:MFS family permease
MDVVRNETDAERYDRNWVELVQELRVAQTGVQILAGFLLTLPFTDRFAEIDDGYRALFLVAFGLAVFTTGLMIAPVMLHRILFGRHAKDTVVRIGNRLVKAAMASLGLTMAAVAALIFGVVVGAVAAVGAAVAALAFYAAMWIVLPMGVARREGIS